MNRFKILKKSYLTFKNEIKYEYYIYELQSSLLKWIFSLGKEKYVYKMWRSSGMEGMTMPITYSTELEAEEAINFQIERENLLKSLPKIEYIFPIRKEDVC